MPISEPKPRRDDDGQLYTQVDDEQFDDLSQLNGQPIVHASIWEEGLAESLTFEDDDSAQDDEVAADIDLYLRDGVYFELYGTLCYTDLDEPPLQDLNQVESMLHALVQAGVNLDEVAVDEDDGLVLVLAQKRRPVLYLQVGAWLLDEWEELPEST